MKAQKRQTFQMTPTRFYNHLEDQGEKLVKSSIHSEKIRAEISYYQNLPKELAVFHPAFLGTSNAGLWETGYAIEKIPSCDYGQIFTGLCASEVEISDVLDGVRKYLNAVPIKLLDQGQWSEKIELQVLLRGEARLHSLKGQSYFNEVEKVFRGRGWSSIDAFLEALNRRISKASTDHVGPKAWKSHGDMCFSNIIPHNDQLYMIDPKGHAEDEDGYLIPYYDLAKISQCLLGGYDFINNEVDYGPELLLTGPKVETFRDFVASFELSYELTRLVEASHFFSMLPLHISAPKKVLAFSLKSVELYEAFK